MYGTVPIDDVKETENYGDIDHWLEESGRRRHSAEWVESLYTPTKVLLERRIARPRLYVRQPGLLLLFAVAAMAYAILYFMEVQLAMTALPKIIVFVALQ